ncbi:MAG TPA: hypothetical protein VNH11_22055 [Pirellulales bacterium]|nr:hypothetical protein [Pirellulales bacterium]
MIFVFHKQISAQPPTPPNPGERGFRQDDLEKLARFMTGTPIRGVVFIEAEALMRLVNESIGKRREFRLADVDRLLFGNKIIV